MKRLTGAAKLAGVTGWPVKHSKSPRMHGHWLNELQIDGAYLPLPIHPDQFQVAVRGLVASGFQGMNVTIPHKEAAYEIADTLSDAAKAIGAVNTLVFNSDGSIFGDNTDGFGFIENIRQSTPTFDFTKGPTLVLGAGGAARAIIHGLLDAGAPQVYVSNRTLARAQSLEAMDPTKVQALPWEDRTMHCPNLNLLINTTSLGMSGQNPLEMALDDLSATALVTDIVYTPLQTDLLKNAAERGNPTVDGIGMLLHQAVRGFSYWFGQTPTVTPELRKLMLAS